ncbi:MAG: hypothetical protein PVJ33_11895 [Lysobacterales bacterium]
MELLLDHVFILTRPGAPDADLLVDLGLAEGEPNRHRGQGTANRRFFFKGCMLELLYVQDEDELTGGPAAPLNLLDRSSRPGASPFGIVARPVNPHAPWDLPGWDYRPDYLPAGQRFLVGANSDILEEPLLIVSPFGPAAGENGTGALGALTSVRIQVPVRPPSDALRAFSRCRNLSIVRGSVHLAEFEFGASAAGRSEDLRPALPLRILW